MRYLYVTRHFNQSGYAILERLLSEGPRPAAILLHDAADPWRHALWGPLLRAWYRVKCRWYRCRPLRTLRSEETLALRHGLPIIRTGSIKSDQCFEAVKALAPDLIVLGGGWHELLPERIFSLPPLGCINTHPSILPAFRGTSITRWQVLHGVEWSGSTFHYVDDRFDTGGVLAQKRTAVDPHTTPQELFLQLGELGASMMPGLLRAFAQSGRQPSFSTTADAQHTRYFKRWTWNDEALRIDWTRPLRDIHFFALANTQESYEYLGPWFELDGSRWLLRRTALANAPSHSRATESVASFKVEVDDKGVWWLSRAGDPHVLGLVQVQRFDDWFRWRRAATPGQRLHTSVDVTFGPTANRP